MHTETPKRFINIKTGQIVPYIVRADYEKMKVEREKTKKNNNA